MKVNIHGLANLIIFMFWTLMVILVLKVQENFTNFEWLVLSLLSLIGLTIVYDKPWFIKEEEAE